MKRLRQPTLGIINVAMAIGLSTILSSCAAMVVEGAKAGHSKSQRVKYEKAAMAGDPKAQFELAESYCCGFGGYYDNNEAYRWYCQAAKQGYAESMYKLGIFFRGGEGLAGPVTMIREKGSMPKDNGFSYAFLYMASQTGHEEATEKAKKVYKEMTQSEYNKSNYIYHNAQSLTCNFERDYANLNRQF